MSQEKPKSVTGHCVLAVGVPDVAAKMLERFFSARGFQVEQARTIEDARRVLETQQPRCLFLDQDVAGVDGFEALRVLRHGAIGPNVGVYYVTERRTIELETLARAAGVSAVLLKPLIPEQLQRIVEDLDRGSRRPGLGGLFLSPALPAGAPAHRGPVPASRTTSPAGVSGSALAGTSAAAIEPPVTQPLEVKRADWRSLALTEDEIRGQLDIRLRQVSEGLLMQVSDIKAVVAEITHQQTQLSTEPASIRAELRAGLGETHHALRLVSSRIEGIEREMFSQLTQMRMQLDSTLKSFSEKVDDLSRHARQAAADEAQLVAERTVMSAAMRISDQLSDAILGAARR